MRRLDEDAAAGEEAREPTHEPASGAAAEKTTVGNYFISNYPPYSFWNEGALGALEQRLQAPPEDAWLLRGDEQRNPGKPCNSRLKPRR